MCSKVIDILIIVCRENMKQRSNLKFCFKFGKMAKQTLEMLMEIYDVNYMSLIQVFSGMDTSKIAKRIYMMTNGHVV